tara:strand:- start:171407 stop:176269 length:4863 start_codon:yes stop_codon:yes gene_type:complete
MHKALLLICAVACTLLSTAQFLENKGQVVDLNQNFHPEVDYYAGVGNASVFFEKDKVVFNFREKEEFDFSQPKFQNNKDLRDSIKSTLGSTFHRLDLQLIGTNSEVEIRGEEKTDHYTNFFLNKRENIRNVSSFNTVRYHDVYPDIDLIFHFTENGLKYDFILKEGANIRDIKFKYAGAKEVKIDSEGKLQIVTEFGKLVEDIPLSFLDDDKNKEVKVQYDLNEKNVIQFKMEEISYEQLTIDPFLSWATYFEGSIGDNELDYYSSIADDLGNYFLEGWINDDANDYPTVDPGGSAYFQNYVSNNLYIAKFDADRNLVWATYYGGSTSIDWSTATDPLAIHGTTLHFVGSQLSTDAPLVNGGGYYYGAPSSDPYWLRINKNTGELLHATAFPSHTSSQPSVATSNSGLVAIIQQTYDFGNPEIVNRPGAYNQAVNGGYQDMHIMLFNSSFNLIWGTFLGGPNTTDNFHVTFDDNDNIFFVGEANNTFSPTAANTHLQSYPGSYYQSTYSAAMGNHDLIIGKFNASGALIWHTLYGGDASDGLKSQMGNGSRVIIDPDTQDLIVIGGTNSSNFPVQNLTGAYNMSTAPANNDPNSGSFWDFNSFIIKFNNDGARNWGTYWGDDPSGDLLYDAVFTGCDKFIVSSRSDSHATIPSATGYNQATGGQGFLMQFDANFSAEWSSYVSSDMGEPTIAHSSLDNRLYIGGSTWSESITTFNPGNGAYYDDTNDDPDAGTTSPAFIIYELDLNPQISGPATACTGETISLSGSGTPAGSNPWSSSNTGVAIVDNSGNVTGQSAGTAVITYTDNAGCSANYTVTVNAGPTASASAVSTTVCEGDNIQLTGNTVGGATYSWTGPNGFTSSNEDPTISNAVAGDAGTYSLVITSGGCSSAADNVNITVNNNPTANAGVVSNTICAGDDIELTGNTVSGATYSWTGPNGFTSSNEDPTISGATTAADGTYSLTITNNGCTSATDNVNVTVNPTPTANANATSTSICEGDNIELTGNTVSGATYSWTGPNGFTSSDEDPTINNATSSEAGTYTLVITQGSCSSAGDNVTVSVDPVPTAIAGAVNGAVCEGDDIELTGNTVSGATYSWTGPNGFTSSSEDPTLTGVTVAADGTYSLEITVGSCTSASSGVTITVNEPATLSASGTDISCFGEADGEATVSATGNGPFSYSWSPSGGNAATATGLTEDTYIVTVTDNNNCESTETVTINEPTEIVLTTSTTQSQCTVDDGSATVSASGGSGTYTYQWDDANSQTTATATNLGAGSYQITVTDDTGCSASETVNVSAVNGPAVTIINVSDVDCPNGQTGSAEADVTGGTSPYSYEWTPSNQTTATATGLSAGNYTVQVTDDAGCIGTANITINEPAPFDVSATVNDANCGQSNGDVIVTASGANGNLSYDWSPGNETTNSLLNISGGTYSLTITDDQGCTFDTLFVVNATGGFSAVVTPDTVTIDPGDLVNISTTVDPNVSGETYSWSPSDDLSCSDCPDPVASPDESTTYIVTIQTADGCSETDTVQIFVDDPCGKVFVPNMFSPNNDGKNDELCVYGGCLTSFEINIYNRWGEVVYRSNDPEMCWNGTYKNEQLNTGVFAYKLIYVDQNGEEQSESGNIQLIR